MAELGLNDPVVEEKETPLVRQLRREIEALQSANRLQKRQILEAMRAMDRMLVEVEAQRNDLREANHTLSLTHQLLDRVTESMDDLLIVVDPQGRISRVNRAAATVLGGVPADFIGRNPDILLGDADVAELAAALPPSPWPTSSVLRETVARHGHWTREVCFGGRPGVEAEPESGPVFLLRGAVMTSPHGQEDGLVLIAGDITALKRREAALRQETERADQAGRAKSDFLAHMSHELRTPLNAIIGFSDAILMGLFGPIGIATYEDYIRHIHQAGTHLLAIINDILDLSKIEANRAELQEEICVLGTLVETAVAMARPRADKVRLSLAVAPCLPEVRLWGDQIRLTQVLTNLLSNAVKFTPEGGHITVGASLRPDGALDVVVVDTGIGIAPEDIPKVLEPFGQVRSALTRGREGTGLGLPLTRRLVEMHGGRLSLASRQGMGTVVTVTLPPQRILFAECRQTEDLPCPDGDRCPSAQGAAPLRSPR